MHYKLFPCPTDSICTPFVFNNNSFKALHYLDNRLDTVRIKADYYNNDVQILSSDNRVVQHYSLPDRSNAIRFIKKHRACDELCLFMRFNTVIPTFSFTISEAIIRAIIRQIIRASHAKYLISNFIKCYGFNHLSFYGFPSVEKLTILSISEYRHLGLGMKSKYIYDLIKVISNSPFENVTNILGNISGIGPWSRAIITMDLSKTYSLYPFDDKSGQVIDKVFKLDLQSISRYDLKLAADLYLYAASYLENKK